MKFDFEIEGLDEVQKNIEKLQKKVKKVGRKQNVKLVELLPDSFIKKHSNYNSLESMIDSSPKEINSEKDLESEEWNKFIKENSKFNSWEEMLQVAHAEWVKKEIKL